MSCSWRPLSLIVACAVAYGSVLAFDFVYDDHWTVLHNPALDRPPGELLTAIAGAGTEAVDIPDASRPLMVLSMWVERAIFGGSPLGYHLVSFLLHFACVLAAWRLGRILTRREDVALIGAAWFAVLPANIEVVASINYREDLYATFGILLTLVVFLAPTRREHGWGRAAGVAAAAAVALLGKEVGVALALLIPLLGDRSVAFWRRRERSVTALFAIFGSYLAWRMTFALGDDGVARSTSTFGEALAKTPAYLAWAFTRPFWPAHPVPVPEALEPASAVSGTFAVLWLLLFILAIVARRASPTRSRKRGTRAVALRGLAGAALIWLVAPIVTSPLVGPANERADRYVYLASFGATLALAVIGASLCRALLRRLARDRPAHDRPARLRRRVLPVEMTRLEIAAPLALALALGVCTNVVSRVYRDDVALFEHAVDVHAESAKAWAGLGWALRRAGRYPASERALAESLRIDRSRPHTRVVLGGLELVRGDAAAARAIVEDLEARHHAPSGLSRLRRCLDSEAPRRCLGDPPLP